MRRRRETRADQYEHPVYKQILARVAGNVRRLRASRGWTQEEAAHQSDMAVRVFQRVERGEVNVTTTTLARVCVGFGVDVADLFRPGRSALHSGRR